MARQEAGNYFCEKCRKETFHARTVSVGRQCRICTECKNILFDDPSSGAVNTTESLLH